MSSHIDLQLVDHVRQYLVHQRTAEISLEDIVTFLRSANYEYSRRKLKPFRTLVKHAYDIILKESRYGKHSASSEEVHDEEAQMLEEEEEVSLKSNIMNNTMTGLYGRKQIMPVSSSPILTVNENSIVDCGSSKQKRTRDQIAAEEIEDDVNDEDGESALNYGESSCSQFESGKSDQSNGKESHEQSKVSSASALSLSYPPLTMRQPHNNTTEAKEPQGTKESADYVPDITPSSPFIAMQDGFRKTGQLPIGYACTPSSIKRIRKSDVDDNASSLSVSRPAKPYRRKSSTRIDYFEDPRLQTVSNLPPKKKFKKTVEPITSITSIQNVGGMKSTLKELCEMLLLIKKPELILELGMSPPYGFLFHGPSGVGKTLLAHAVAALLKMKLIEVMATELIAGLSGESEERIRDIFEQAKLFSPCVLFIDEIDAIGGNRNNASKDMERRMAAQLINCMDKLQETRHNYEIVIIGATTRPDMLDPALRRIGRFENEITLPIPDCNGRYEILKILCRGLIIDPYLNYKRLAEWTPGFVGADLKALVSRAVTFAVKRKYTENFYGSEADADSNVSSNEVSFASNQDQEDENKTVPNEIATLPELVPVLLPIQGTEIVQNEPIAVELTKPKEEEEEEVMMFQGNKSDELPCAKFENNSQSEKTTDDEEVEYGKSNPSLFKLKSLNIKDKEPTLEDLLAWIEFPSIDITDYNSIVTMEDFKQAIKVVKPSAKLEGFITVPDVTWDDIGSLQQVREELKLAVLAPVKYPERLKSLGLSAPSGVLLCGPPGCGKTLLAKAVANEAGINFISVKGPELMSMYVGESERAVRMCFQRARNSAPCVIFFDEFDSLCPKRTASSDSGSGTRIVNQLLTEMDGIEDRRGVYILAATNRPDIIDPAILRPGRLDTILYVGLPELEDRIEILNATTKMGTRPLLHEDVCLLKLGVMTHGFTGADLAGFVRQAAMLALKDTFDMQNYPPNYVPYVRKKHFEQAMKMVRPSVSEAEMKMYDKMRIKYAAPRPKSDEAKEDDE